MGIAYTSGMSRLRRLLESRRIFFVTTHFARAVLPITDPEKQLVMRSLADVRERRAFLLLAYCVMPTHVHLLFAPADEDTLDNILREVKIRSSKSISLMRGAGGNLWQARSFDRIMRNGKELAETIDYIHFNPVKDGLVKKPCEWKWSSWQGWQTSDEPPIPCDRMELPVDEKAPLRW